jgi:hypothetical protein
MSATPRLDKLRALTPLERRVLGEALAMLPLACASLRLSGLRRTQARLARLLRNGAPQEGIDATTVARLVSIAARHGPVRAKCLPASLTLASMLRRYGMHGQLRLGVRRHEGRIEAHAWIEHEGRALLEPGVHSRFGAFEGRT